MNNKDTLVKNTLMISFGTLLSKGIQFVLVIFVSSWLTTEDYGTFDVICTYVTLLLPLLSLSTGEAVFRFSASSKTPEEQSCYITTGFFLVVCNFFLCTVGIAVLSYFKVLSSKLVLPFLCLLAAQLLNHYLQAFLRAIKRLALFTVSNVAFTFMVTVFSVLFVYLLQRGLTGLIYAYASGYLIANIFIIISAKFWRYIFVKKASGKVLMQLIRYSFPLVPNDVSWWVLNVSDRQVILVALGSAANGIYAIANKIPALCSSIFGMFGVSWQQSMVEHIEEEGWQQYANRVYNQMTTILLTICSGILSVTFVFYTYMFDKKYFPGIIYVPILLTAIIFSTRMSFFGGIQIALKKTVENGITTVVGAIVNLIIDIVLIRFIGLYAAAISTLIANMVADTLRRYRLKHVVCFRFEHRTIFCLLIYGYFIMSFYLFQNHVILEWINVVLAGIAFVFINRSFILSVLRR